MRFRITPTIANNVFAITTILLVLMTAITVMSALMSREVGHLVSSVEQTYLPSYGNLARAQIRSLEQSFLLRRAVIQRLEKDPDTTIAATLGDEDKAAATVARELAAAHGVLEAQAQKDFGFDDQVLLGKIIAEIEELQGDRKEYGAVRDRLRAAILAGDHAAMDPALAEIDDLRDRIAAELETARRNALVLVSEAVRKTDADQRTVVGLSFLALALAALIGIAMAIRIARRLLGSVEPLVDATHDVEKGDYGREVPVVSEDEIGQIARGFNRMLAELRVKERIRETFGRFVDPRLVKDLVERPELAGTTGDRRVMTIVICDMQGFTKLTEQISPTLMVTLLNRYFALTTAEVRSRHGIVDKLVGDAVFSFFGPPFVDPADQARLAGETGLAQVARFEEFRTELPAMIGVKRFMADIGIRVGIATGEVVVGSIGSATAMNYTVIGDTVNTAARLESVNKVYGTRILVNEETMRGGSPALLFREIDRVLLAGKEEPVSVYELMAQRDTASDAQLKLCETYAAALEAYRRRDWRGAKRAFDACLALAPADRPSAVLRERVERYAATAPAKGWDGTFVLTEK
ncbi:MAG: adenylate/guanylate cyclase domain-containing protein [Hyphomicrobiales bacterium]